MKVLSALTTVVTTASASLFRTATTTPNSNNDFVDPTWYTAYSHYPEYCSTPDQMAQRTIPTLAQDDRVGETRLVHVTASIRHGARTPTEGGFTCWDGYWDDPATGVWDCDLKVEMAPPTPKQFLEQQGRESSGSNGDIVLFEKHYDALMDKDDNLANGLFGTCQTGQLLTRGYAQHAKNGQLLRDAYTFSSDKYEHDVKMRLIDLKQERPWELLELRSDDDSRVLMSGQVLVRSLLESELEQANSDNLKDPVRIPVHLADRQQDVIGINSQVCPRLAEMRTNFEKSSIFRSFNHSKEAKEIRTFMKNKLKVPQPPGEMDILGCLLPTICTDRPLPAVFDYPHSEMVERMIQFAYKKFNMHLLANAAEFSKLAMAPVWAEIMDKINPILSGEREGSELNLNRLHVVSGHDDTVAPLMASLGIWNDTAWPPYASMFLIEIHQNIDGQADATYFKSKFAFRLLYDGQVVTNQIEGCLDDAELCDIKVFTDIVSEFATRDRDCRPKKRFFSSVAGTGGMPSAFKSFLLILVGIAVGGAVMTYYLTGSLSLPKRRGCISSGATFSEGSLSMPSGAYSDEPESGGTSYHNNRTMGAEF